MTPKRGLVVLTPQPAAIATPVAPLVAGTMPAQAVVVAAPQVGAGGKQPKVSQSFYVLPQFAVGSNVPLYAQATGPKKDCEDSEGEKPSSPKARCQCSSEERDGGKKRRTEREGCVGGPKNPTEG